MRFGFCTAVVDCWCGGGRDVIAARELRRERLGIADITIDDAATSGSPGSVRMQPFFLQALSDGAEIHVAWTDGSTLASKVMPAEVAGYDLAKSVLGWICKELARSAR